MTFVQTLTAILNDQEEIPGLPDNGLMGLDRDGQALPDKFSARDIVKLVRLQTLATREHFNSSILDAEPSEKGDDQNVPFGVDSDLLKVQEDGILRIMMLEHLIVEIVRSIIPTESECFNVRYAITPTGRVMRCSVPGLRVLD